MRLVQVAHGKYGRRVARVEGEELVVLQGFRSAYQLCQASLAATLPLSSFALACGSDGTLDYGLVHGGHSEWRILPAFDHPDDPAHCLITGTGLTHLRSAEARNAMHGTAAPETDSMRLYRLGLEGGRPPAGQVGVAPEWFYKGNGVMLRAHNETLTRPVYALDGGEEGEVAGIYLIDSEGQPWRVGFAIGNEFSDHNIEAQNYLYLAHSKLRECAIGPELAVNADFESLTGSVRILRDRQRVWGTEIASGERRMAHSLVNLEHHHFKYSAHRQPGDVHIHFFGADVLSCQHGIGLQDGDEMWISFEELGRPLKNTLRCETQPKHLVTVRSL